MVNIELNLDNDALERVQEICADAGLSLSMAAKIFFEQMIRCNGLPFEVTDDPFYSEENIAHLIAAKERIDHTGGTVHNLLEVNDD